MPKKIFDIIPPKGIKKEVINEPPLVFKKELRKSFNKDIFKKIFALRIFIFFIFLAVLGFLGLSFISKTTLKLYPETETLTLVKKIAVNASQNKLDSSLSNDGAVSGQIFSDQKSVSETFSSTGRVIKEEKAKGVIRVYNSYSTANQPLLAQTRFISTEGRIFKSLKQEVIPGGRYENGKLIPGEVDIEVQAAEPGENYNIGPSTFAIPGFAGTPRYTAFYGKSFSKMSGGFKGEASKVTEDDLKRAENASADKAKKESLSFLKKSLPEGFILIDETIFQEITDKKFSKQLNEEAQDFTAEIMVKSRSLIFKQSDIENFVKNYLTENISDNKRFLEDKLEIKYSFDSFDNERNILYLDVEIKAIVYQDIDLDSIKRAVSEKLFDEVKMSLYGDSYQIKNVEVEPGLFFLRKRFPNDLDKIKIELVFD
ncbi:MAG: hypothetical protein PHI53_01660 [Candidatus Pacebacteria bacterium]|nr:hypothetical protein [Candidatus Paceibacterota bacterium]